MAEPNVGLVGSLWHANFKINCHNKGYQSKFPIVTADPDIAKASAISIATAYKRILPMDAEIFYATVSNYNTRRDSRFLRAALGAGLFIGLGVAPDPTTFDTSFASIKLRLETDTHTSVTRLINPVPDAVLTDEEIVPAITDVSATFAGVDPVEGDLTLYALQFENFMKILTKHCKHVYSGAVPGGAFTWSPYIAAMPVGVSKKKGSRAFI